MHSGGHPRPEKQLISAHYATNVRLSHFKPGRIIAGSNRREHNMLEGVEEDTKGGVKGCKWCARTDTDIFAVGLAEQAQDDRPDPCQKQGRGMFCTFPDTYTECEEIGIYGQKLTLHPAIQPHSSRPFRCSRRRTMGLLHLRERAHGTEADSRANKRHWQAQSRRTIPVGRPTRASVHQ
jgi:hypothetical protein